jgi:hypothetical protein
MTISGSRDEAAGGAPGTTSLVASHEASGLVVDTTHDLHAAHHDPQHQEVNQNLRVALVPLALLVFAVLVFVAAAWTFLAAS